MNSLTHWVSSDVIIYITISNYDFTIVFISGKCDSYVKIRLLPEEKFVEIKLPKTHVQKETLFPLFDETFNMLVKLAGFFIIP